MNAGQVFNKTLLSHQEERYISRTRSDPLASQRCRTKRGCLINKRCRPVVIMEIFQLDVDHETSYRQLSVS